MRINIKELDTNFDGNGAGFSQSFLDNFRVFGGINGGESNVGQVSVDTVSYLFGVGSQVSITASIMVHFRLGYEHTEADTKIRSYKVEETFNSYMTQVQLRAKVMDDI